MGDLAFLSALEQADLVRRREVSPVELVESCLRRIEKLDPSLNAFVTCTGDPAIRAARAAERALVRGDHVGRFHGVPVAIKDLTDTAGIPTTYSSKAFADHVPRRDAACVRRLKETGFVIVGKTNTSEFGNVPVTESDLNGACRNPWDERTTPGGSSGGSAAAVAAGLVPVAHGTDGGGSVRIPASCCGILGLKPARGRISSGPGRGESWAGLSTHGVLARTVADAAAMLDAMAGYETGDPYWAPPPSSPFETEAGAEPGTLRVAFTAAAPGGIRPEPEVTGVLHDTARLLESSGHFVEEATPPWDEAIGVDYLRVTVQATAAYHDIEHLALLEPLTRAMAEAGMATSAHDYVRSKLVLERYAREVVGFWKAYDLLLTPTIPMAPPPVGWLFEEDDVWEQLRRSGLVVPYTRVANVTGQPAASLPLGWADDGSPIGMQLIARPAAEATLLRVCSQLEQARPWGARHPRTF